MMSQSAFSKQEQDKTNQQIQNEMLFKQAFIREYVRFGENARIMAQGNSGFSNAMKDWYITGGISAATVGINGALALLAGFGLLAGTVTGGISIAVSIVGVVAAIGYNVYRYRKNVREAKVADSVMSQTDLTYEGEKIANHLATVYAKELANCNKEEAVAMAKASNEIVTTSIKKGFVHKAKEFFSFTKLKNAFLSWIGLAPKKDQIREKINRAFNEYTPAAEVNLSHKNVHTTEPGKAVRYATSSIGLQSIFSDGKRASNDDVHNEKTPFINPLRVTNR